MRNTARSTGKSKPRRGDAPRRDAAVAQSAERHTKTRRDHSQELDEDYVELIAQLIRKNGEARTVEIANRLGVSHVTVTKRIRRLQNAGLVRSEPYRSIFLTSTGQQLARQAEARHEVVVAFLHKIGVNPADAETDAEGIEHHLSAATLTALRRFVESNP